MFNFKRLTALVLLFAVYYSIFTPIFVYAANGWDETTHSRDVTCKQCNGSGGYIVPCPPTVSHVCTRCPNAPKAKQPRGQLYFCNSKSCDSYGKEFSPTRWYDDWGYMTSCCNFWIGESARIEFCPMCMLDPDPMTNWDAYTGIYKTDCPSCSGSGSITQSCQRTQKEYDNTLPTLSTSKSLDAQDPAYLGQPVTVTCTATDNLSGVSMYEFSFS